MADIGLVKGNSIEKNIDGDGNVRMLQVQVADPNDVQNVELMQASGEDTCPVIDSNVLIVQIAQDWQVAIACDDNIEPSVDGGEKEFYSIDPTTKVKKLRIKLLNDGGLEITNGSAEITIDGSTNQIAFNGHLTVDL